MSVKATEIGLLDPSCISIYTLELCDGNSCESMVSRVALHNRLRLSDEGGCYCFRSATVRAKVVTVGVELK